MNIFIVHIPYKGAIFNALSDALKPFINCSLIFSRNYPLLGKHACMSTTTSNILRRHGLIYLK